MENITTPIPETPIMVEKPKTNYINLVLISLACILFSIGVYFLGRQSVKPPEVTTIVLPLTTAIPTQTIDPTANWKTYTNSKYSFTVSYPTDFKVDNSNNITTIYKGEMINSPPVDPFSNSASVSFSFTTSLTDTTEACYENDGIMGACADFTNSNELFTKNTVSFSNVAGISVQSDNDKNRKLYYLKGPVENKVVEVLLWDPNSITNLKLLEQILSTFKFTENKEKNTSQKEIVYIKNIETVNGQNHLTADYVQMLACKTCPDGYQIVNSNPLLRDLLIDQNVKITYLTSDSSVRKSMSLIDFMNLDKNNILFNIEMNSQNIITNIDQVFVP